MPKVRISKPREASKVASFASDAGEYYKYLVKKQIRGLETAWLEFGNASGPILFFCHGFPDSAYAWQEQFSEFEKQFYVVAPFVRGCEGSEPGQGLSRYSPESVLLDHLEILATIDPDQEKPIIVVGHDLGAVHAIELARSLNSRIKGLTIINGLDCEMFRQRLGDASQVAKSWYMGVMQIPVLPELLFKTVPSTLNWLAGEIGQGKSVNLESNLSSNQQKLSKETAKEILQRRTVAPLNQYRAFARELGKKRPASKRIACPTLVLWGRDDGFLNIPDRTEWLRVALDVTIRILPGGHWVHREDGAMVNQLLDGFIRDCLNRKG